MHLLSFAGSFGLVIFSDFLMLEFPLRGFISKSNLDLISKASKAISLGLFVLILSGLSFLIYYKFKSPELLSNPKLYSKMLVVTILSLNGVWLHKRGIRLLGQFEDKKELSTRDIPIIRRLMMAGAVSAISWWTAFIMGTFRELNFRFSFTLLTGIYAIAVFAALAGLYVITPILFARKSTGRSTKIQIPAMKKSA